MSNYFVKTKPILYTNTDGDDMPSNEICYGPYDGATYLSSDTIQSDLLVTEIKKTLDPIPVGLKVLIKTENTESSGDYSLKEYWYTGTRGFEECTGGGSESSIGGSISLLSNYSILVSKSEFDIATDSDGYCTNDILIRDTTAEVRLFNQTTQVEFNNNGVTAIFPDSTSEYLEFHCEKNTEDESDTYYKIWYTFKDEALTTINDKQMGHVLDLTIFLNFLFNSYNVSRAINLRASKCGYSYIISCSTDYYAISKDGVAPTIIVDVDKYDYQNGLISDFSNNINYSFVYLDKNGSDTTLKSGTTTSSGDIRLTPSDITAALGGSPASKLLFGENIIIIVYDGTIELKKFLEILKESNLVGAVTPNYAIGVTKDNIILSESLMGTTESTIVQNLTTVESLVTYNGSNEDSWFNSLKLNGIDDNKFKIHLFNVTEGVIKEIGTATTQTTLNNLLSGSTTYSVNKFYFDYITDDCSISAGITGNRDYDDATEGTVEGTKVIGISTVKSSAIYSLDVYPSTLGINSDGYVPDENQTINFNVYKYANNSVTQLTAAQLSDAGLYIQCIKSDGNTDEADGLTYTIADNHSNELYLDFVLSDINDPNIVWGHETVDLYLIPTEGKAGKYGDYYITVYLNTTSATESPQKPNNLQITNLTTTSGTWTTEQQARSTGLYTWQTTILASYDNNNNLSYGNWSSPICITGENGKNGADGLSREYIFYLAHSGDTVPSEAPNRECSSNTKGTAITEDDWYGTDQNGITWTDDPLGVSKYGDIEYVCTRSSYLNGKTRVWCKYNRDGESSNLAAFDETFSYAYTRPSIYTVFSSDGKPADYYTYKYQNKTTMPSSPTGTSDTTWTDSVGTPEVGLYTWRASQRHYYELNSDGTEYEEKTDNWVVMRWSGADGLGVAMAYCTIDHADAEAAATGIPTSNGWSTTASTNVYWVSFKSGTAWSTPMHIRGNDGTSISVKASASDCTKVGDGYIGDDGHLYMALVDGPETDNTAHWKDCGSVKGDSGKSAYELAVSNGYSGTLTEWLNSLIGSSAYIHIKYSDDGITFTPGVFYTDEAYTTKYTGSVYSWGGGSEEPYYTLNNFVTGTRIYCKSGEAPGETYGKYKGMYCDSNKYDSVTVSDYAPWNLVTGNPGKDAINTEWIYLLHVASDADDRIANEVTGVTANTPTTAPNNLDGTVNGVAVEAANASTTNDFVPDGWSDNPIGVSKEGDIEYACQRLSINDDEGHFKAWGEFTAPTLWSQFGHNGQDGDGIEYIFYRSSSVSETIGTPVTIADAEDSPAVSLSDTTITDYYIIFVDSLPDTPASGKPVYITNSDKRCFIYDGHEWVQYVGQFWTDDPLGVSKSYPYEYVSKRISINGAWSAYSTPVLWSNYAFDGSSPYTLTTDNDVVILDDDCPKDTSTVISTTKTKLTLKLGSLSITNSVTYSASIADGPFEINGNTSNNSGTFSIKLKSDLTGYTDYDDSTELKLGGSYKVTYTATLGGTAVATATQVIKVLDISDGAAYRIEASPQSLSRSSINATMCDDSESITAMLYKVSNGTSSQIVTASSIDTSVDSLYYIIAYLNYQDTSDSLAKLYKLNTTYSSGIATVENINTQINTFLTKYPSVTTIPNIILKAYHYVNAENKTYLLDTETISWDTVGATGDNGENAVTITTNNDSVIIPTTITSNASLKVISEASVEAHNGTGLYDKTNLSWTVALSNDLSDYFTLPTTSYSGVNTLTNYLKLKNDVTALKACSGYVLFTLKEGADIIGTKKQTVIVSESTLSSAKRMLVSPNILNISYEGATTKLDTTQLDLLVLQVKNGETSTANMLNYLYNLSIGSDYTNSYVITSDSDSYSINLTTAELNKILALTSGSVLLSLYEPVSSGKKGFIRNGVVYVENTATLLGINPVIVTSVYNTSSKLLGYILVKTTLANLSLYTSVSGNAVVYEESNSYTVQSLEIIADDSTLVSISLDDFSSNLYSSWAVLSQYSSTEYTFALIKLAGAAAVYNTFKDTKDGCMLTETIDVPKLLLIDTETIGICRQGNAGEAATGVYNITALNDTVNFGNQPTETTVKNSGDLIVSFNYDKTDCTPLLSGGDSSSDDFPNIFVPYSYTLNLYDKTGTIIKNISLSQTDISSYLSSCSILSKNITIPFLFGMTDTDKTTLVGNLTTGCYGNRVMTFQFPKSEADGDLGRFSVMQTFKVTNELYTYALNITPAAMTREYNLKELYLESNNPILKVHVTKYDNLEATSVLDEIGTNNLKLKAIINNADPSAAIFDLTNWVKACVSYLINNGATVVNEISGSLLTILTQGGFTSSQKGTGITFLLMRGDDVILDSETVSYITNGAPGAKGDTTTVYSNSYRYKYMGDYSPSASYMLSQNDYVLTIPYVSITAEESTKDGIGTKTTYYSLEGSSVKVDNDYGNGKYVPGYNPNYWVEMGASKYGADVFNNIISNYVQAGKLQNTDGSAGIKTSDSDGILIWAGDLVAKAPFKVTEEGNLTANLGTIGGWTISDSGLTSSNDNVTIDSSGNVTCTVDGTTKWKLSSDGSITANNATFTNATLSGSVHADKGIKYNFTKSAGLVKSSSVSESYQEVTINCDYIWATLNILLPAPSTTYYGKVINIYSDNSQGIRIQAGVSSNYIYYHANDNPIGSFHLKNHSLITFVCFEKGWYVINEYPSGKLTDTKSNV